MPSFVFLAIATSLATLILFVLSSLQFWLLGAGSDLGFFDQLVFLQSQGLMPISTLYKEIHLIGDHVALVLYPIALLYKIHPSIYWLIFVQALSLASGAIPIYLLSRHFQLSRRFSEAITLCYLLYPVIFNANFYADFRTEVIAVPALLWALFFLRSHRWLAFYVTILLTLLTKDILTLTVATFGIWIAIFQRRWLHGLAVVVMSAVWFGVAFFYVIPNFRGDQGIASIGFYAYLGDSFREIVANLIQNPSILIARVLAIDNLFYYLLLVLPILGLVKLTKITDLVPAIATLGMNTLSDGWQRDLIHHYSLPILPFLFFWAIDSVASWQRSGKRLWLKPRWAVLWSIAAFCALAKYGYFYERYLPKLPEAIALHQILPHVHPGDRVLSTSHVVSLLTQRPVIRLLEGGGWPQGSAKPENFDAIVLSYPFATTAERARLDRLIPALLADSKHYQGFVSIDRQSFVFRRKV